MVERGILLAAYPLHDGDWDSYTSGCCSTKRQAMPVQEAKHSVRGWDSYTPNTKRLAMPVQETKHAVGDRDRGLESIFEAWEG